MTNWAKLLKEAEISEVSANNNRKVVVDVPKTVLDFVTKLKAPGPQGRRQQADVPIPDGDDYMSLRAIFKAAGDRMEPMVSVTVKPVYAEGDEELVKTTKDGKTIEKWLPKEGALPGWLRVSVGPRRGGPGKKQAASSDGASDGTVPDDESAK